MKKEKISEVGDFSFYLVDSNFIFDEERLVRKIDDTYYVDVYLKPAEHNNGYECFGGTSYLKGDRGDKSFFTYFDYNKLIIKLYDEIKELKATNEVVDKPVESMIKEDDISCLPVCNEYDNLIKTVDANFVDVTNHVFQRLSEWKT